MAKTRKKAAAPEAPIEPQVGDKVTVGTGVYEIIRVHYGGDEVDLQFPGTNLMRFRVPIAKLTYVERKPPAKNSNPFTNPEPTLDAGEVLERIRTVELSITHNFFSNEEAELYVGEASEATP
jgi:hypothetical protein